MELFGREMTIEQVIGFVRCNATPDEDLIHRAALELVAELEASQRRVDELFSNNQECSAVLENALIELGKSQRRERAAVDDLKDALYDTLAIDCEYCKYRGAETDEHVATTGGCHACENHGGFYDCFEWRGPRESGEEQR